MHNCPPHYSLSCSPYDGKWSKSMVGYGKEDNHFVVELTYNYGIKSYRKGNDFQVCMVSVCYMMYLYCMIVAICTAYLYTYTANQCLFKRCARESKESQLRAEGSESYRWSI